MEKQSYKSIGSNGSAMCVGPVGWAFDTKNDIMNAAKVSADLLQAFFTTNLRSFAGQEYEAARDYAYSRWPEDFCSEAGIGYAPSERQPFEDYCRQKGINEDLLFELGMLRRREDGGTYPMFRERIMIPVRNRWGRVIAYTARYIGTNPQAPKYINLATSIIYAKGETLFGMDRAFRMKNSDNYIIVEGAPDVLRMQSVGLENTVASLGTAWNENQFDLLKNYTDALRQYGLFIRNNCYFALGDDDEDPVRISNFVMEPLFHIEDESNGVRLFHLRNFSGQCRIIELKESELCSLTNFQQKAGSLGNYVWLAKIDKLNRVKEFLYARTDTAERIRKLGWNASEGFFAFGNGLFADGSFHPVDSMGIVRRDTTGKVYYIPATSQIFYHNPEIYQFERLMVHTNKSGVLLRDYVEKVHYRIRYLTRFRPMNVREDMEFMEARPILYLNMAAISSLFSSRNSTQNITANRSSWSTILSYLKSHASFLGLKQDCFSILLPNGTPDYTFEQKDGKMVKSVKVNRSKALCFDYLQLKEAFGMDLETEVVAEGSEEDE